MTDPRDAYLKMLEQLAGGELSALQRKCFELLKAHPEGLTRQEFVLEIFGYRPVNVAGDTNDRKVRKALEALRGRLFPIVSTSARAGYRLDTSRDAVMGMVREWMSRRDKLTDLINKAVKFYEIPVAYAEPVHAVQLEFGIKRTVAVES